jgi:hypothetical protein
MSLTTTILGPHDFVVIARGRQRGPARRAGAWTLAGIADDAAVAEAMAGLISSSDPLTETRTLSHSAIFHKVSGADREQIVALLENRTTADIARSETLRQAALAQLADAEPGMADALLGRARRTRQRVTPERLADVARVARQHPRTPTAAVQRRFRVSRSYARRLIKKAEEAELD